MIEMQPDLYGGPPVPAEQTPSIRPPDLTPPPTWAGPIRALILRSAASTGFTVQQICGDNRRHCFFRARAAIALVAAEMGKSSSEIGRAMGGRHHTTILRQERIARDLVKTDIPFRHLVERVRG